MKKKQPQQVHAPEPDSFLHLAIGELFPRSHHLFPIDSEPWVELSAEPLLEVEWPAAKYGTWGIYQDYLFTQDSALVQSPGAKVISVSGAGDQRKSILAVPIENCFVVGYRPLLEDAKIPGLAYVSGLHRFLIFPDSDPYALLKKFGEFGDPPLHQRANAEGHQKYLEFLESTIDWSRSVDYAAVYGQWLPGKGIYLDGDGDVSASNRWLLPYRLVYHTLEWKRG